MEIKNEIFSALKKVLKEFSLEEINFLVEKPENESFGDYSTNIAMAIFANSKLKAQRSKPKLKVQSFNNPLGIAQTIKDSMIRDSKFMIHFDKVEAVAPGFINFYLSKEYLINQLSLMQDKTPLRPAQRNFAGRSIMVEFTDPNPFKEFHIGHLYSNTVGESISRLLEALGADIKRANYQGDVGMHVAKALYGLLQSSKFKIQSSKLDEKSLQEKIKTLGKAYVFGAKDYGENEKARREIEQLNKKIYAKDPVIMPLYEKGRRWSLEYFENVYKRLGTKFDFYYFESEVGIDGLKLVKDYLKKGIFEESQGAVIFPGKKQGLHDRVFINSLGLPTYEAKDLGLAFKKYSDFKFDQSISVTGNEIIGYFKVILAALKQINPELASKIKHLPHGMVRLPTGKMSSRSGNIVTGEWLMDEAKKLLKSKYPEMTQDSLEQVTVGAVKYALLKNSLGHDIEFNFEESINIQGNSGPYLQYTFARTQSVLSKIAGAKNEISFKRPPPLKLEAEEVSLLRVLSRFSEVVAEAGEKFAPNLLCNYLFDLAQEFNLFYQKHRILRTTFSGVNEKHPEGVIKTGGQENFRLTLTYGVGQVLKSGLNLLGIAAPEKM